AEHPLQPGRLEIVDCALACTVNEEGQNTMNGFGERSSSELAYRRDGSWKDMGTSMSAISFGLAATAILISMFLVMAIFEHLIKPRASFLRSRNNAHGSSELHRPQAQIHRSQEKVQNSITVGTQCASDLSVLMPGQRFPTYIAQPAPLPCPREGIIWPSHVAHVSYM
ncbi:unnamed protein product, partial [Musa hybrid cultivar]